MAEQDREATQTFEEGVESGFSLIQLAAILAVLGVAISASQIIKRRWQHLRSDVEGQLLPAKESEK